MSTYVFANEEQQGPFEDDAIQAGLKSGKYSPDDLAWREGMDEWQPLRRLVSLPPPLPTNRSAPSAPTHAVPSGIPILFGSRWKTDGFGFVRRGVIAVNASVVRIEGPRRWHALARIALFVVGWFVSMHILGFVFGGIGSALGGVLGAFIAIVFGNAVTAAVLTLWLVQNYLASPSTLTFEKADISGINREGAVISFHAIDLSRKSARAVIQARSEHEAAELVQQLR